MIKSDLRSGMIVELRDGTLMLVVNNIIAGVHCNLELNDYYADLTFAISDSYDIVAVYDTRGSGFILSDLDNNKYEFLTLLWTRAEKIKLTSSEKEILKNIQNFNYITRDSTDLLELYVDEPIRSVNNICWSSQNGYQNLNLFGHMFQTVKPMTYYKISELLED